MEDPNAIADAEPANSLHVPLSPVRTVSDKNSFKPLTLTGEQAVRDWRGVFGS